MFTLLHEAQMGSEPDPEVRSLGEALGGLQLEPVGVLADPRLMESELAPPTISGSSRCPEIWRRTTGSVFCCLAPHLSICGAMRRYAGLCGAMRRYAALCGAMRCYAALCGAMRRYAALCGAMRCYAAPMRCYAVLCGPVKIHAPLLPAMQCKRRIAETQ